MFGHFTAFVILSMTALGVSAQVANCTRSYTIQIGDTCNLISAKTDTSTFQLSHVNTNINAACTNLIPGDSLCLGQTGEDCRATTVVQSGDSCTSLAALVGITDALLLANNPNLNSACTNLGIGLVLCTGSTSITYT